MGQGFITRPAVGIVAGSRRSRPLGLTRRGLFRPERALGSAQLRLEGLEVACELREQLEVRGTLPASLAFPRLPGGPRVSLPALASVPTAAHSCSQRFPAFPRTIPDPGIPAIPRHSRPRHAHCCRSRCPQLLDGRRRTGGRLEVWVRIREPLGPQRQLEPRSERWLVLEPGAEATVSDENPPGTRGVGLGGSARANPELLLLRSPFPNRPWRPQRTGTTGEGLGRTGNREHREFHGEIIITAEES